MTFRGDPTRDVFGVYDGFVRTTAARAATHSGRLRAAAAGARRGRRAARADVCGGTATVVCVWRENGQTMDRSANNGDATCFVKSPTAPSDPQKDERWVAGSHHALARPQGAEPVRAAADPRGRDQDGGGPGAHQRRRRRPLTGQSSSTMI